YGVRSNPSIGFGHNPNNSQAKPLGCHWRLASAELRWTSTSENGRKESGFLQGAHAANDRCFRLVVILNRFRQCAVWAWQPRFTGVLPIAKMPLAASHKWRTLPRIDTGETPVADLRIRSIRQCRPAGLFGWPSH